MAYYKKKLTYDEISPQAQKFRTWLRANTICAKSYSEATEGDITEVFLVQDTTIDTMRETHWKILNFMQASGFLQVVPFSGDSIALYFKETADGPAPTVSPTHIRLPKLSHLISLCPDDFFALLRLIHHSKKNALGDALSLNPPDAGISNWTESILNPFFTKLRTNYRMNPDYCDKKWTDRQHIARVASLFPSRETHLSAMQFLTAMQNTDLLYFPLDAANDLEIDEPEQINNDYCVPPRDERFSTGG
jgi:hypothetical protein